MASKAFISWIYHFWAQFCPYFNFVDFRAYFGHFSLVKKGKYEKHICTKSRKMNNPIMISKIVLKSVLWRGSEYIPSLCIFQLLCFSLHPTGQWPPILNLVRLFRNNLLSSCNNFFQLLIISQRWDQRPVLQKMPHSFIQMDQTDRCWDDVMNISDYEVRRQYSLGAYSIFLSYLSLKGLKVNKFFHITWGYLVPFDYRLSTPTIYHNCSTIRSCWSQLKFTFIELCIIFTRT